MLSGLGSRSSNSGFSLSALRSYPVHSLPTGALYPKFKQDILRFSHLNPYRVFSFFFTRTIFLTMKTTVIIISIFLLAISAFAAQSSKSKKDKILDGQLSKN